MRTLRPPQMGSRLVTCPWHGPAHSGGSKPSQLVSGEGIPACPDCPDILASVAETFLWKVVCIMGEPLLSGSIFSAFPYWTRR